MKTKLDPIDRKILELLQVNSNITNAQLALEIGLFFPSIIFPEIVVCENEIIEINRIVIVINGFILCDFNEANVF